MGRAAERWRELVEARIAQMEALQAGSTGFGGGAAAGVGGRFWDGRAQRFTKGPMASVEGDPMLGRLRRAVGPRSTVLDVGSGPGRFTLAVAPGVRQVVAVDPSRRMLAILRRRAREQGLANVRTVLGTWQDVDVDPADVVLCSHVLPLVADAPAFVEKLHAAARRRVLLYIGAFAADAVIDPFWRHFHGEPRRPGAGWLDALKVIEELGIQPRVEIVEVRTRSRYGTLAEAVDAYREQLLLPKTAAVRKELTRLLDPWFQRRGGALYPPFRTQPAAILTWEGGARA